MSLVVNPYSYFTDTNGNALNGYLYVGEVGKNAENYPIAIFYDNLFTTPAPNPLTISAGYIYNGGTIAQIYASVDYSIVVKKTDGSLVYSSLNETGMTNGAIANVDEMKNFVAPYDNYVLNVLGYSEAGDGGGGLFYYDANSTEDDNGGTIIEPTSGSGRWIRQYSGAVNVKWFGAKGNGIDDDTTFIQNALDCIKGDDATGIGKINGTLYIPFGVYKITDTLVIDGTSSLKIIANSALNKRNTSNEANHTFAWYGNSTKPVIQLKGATGIPSNPNFNIILENIGIDGSAGGTEALAGIYLGILNGESDNTLNRDVEIKNCIIQYCRFGIYSGNPHGLNTDHAQIVVSACIINNNGQAAVRVGTGNAIFNINNCLMFTNGEDLSSYSSDTYESLLGANIIINSGYCMITNYTSAGNPVSADIYQSNGTCAVINAWSDTSGYFYYQLASTLNGNGGYQTGQITGVRHYRGDMTEIDTPNSIRIITPGTLVSSCNFYGNVVVASGNSGRPIFSGINFIRSNAGFIGDGVNTQRSLLALGTAGNYSQIIQGGVDDGHTLSGLGSIKANQVLTGSQTTGGYLYNILREIKGQKDTDGVINEFYDANTGTLKVLGNGYFSNTTATSIKPTKATENSKIVDIGSRGLEIKGYSNFNTTSEFATSALEVVFKSGGANENENPTFNTVADGEKGHDNGDGTVDGYGAILGSLAVSSNKLVHTPSGANSFISNVFTYLTPGETYMYEVDVASHASSSGIYLRAYNNTNGAFINSTSVSYSTSGKFYLPFEAVANTRLEIVNRNTGGVLTINSIKLWKVTTVNNLKINGAIDGRFLNFSNLKEYSNDATAGAAGLAQGFVYRTSTGELRIKL